MPTRLLALALLAAAASAQAPLTVEAGSAPLMTNVSARDVTSLNGTWNAVVDPYETGYRNILTLEPMNPARRDMYGNDARVTDPADRLEYLYPASRTLRVPGDWNTQADDLFLYEGTVWYQRDVQDPRTDAERVAGRRVFLHVGGANYETLGWLDGTPLGGHEGGFTPFQFEITDALGAEPARVLESREAGGANGRDAYSLVLKVDNRRRRDAVPTLATDWWNYGGLTRDVSLVEVPATFIRDTFVHLDPDAPDHVAGWVQLDGALEVGATVTVRIGALEAQAPTGADGRATFRLPAPDLERWSPDSPYRHTVEIEAVLEDEVLDRTTERIGFRTVETQGTEVLLNGEPIFLRGISMHEERPGGGRASSTEHAATLLGWAREMNANFVRLAHYPHNEHTVALADSLGILLWAEVPVYWAIDWENPETYARAERQMTELVTRDKNRAAVVLWSVANETPQTDARLSFLRGLVRTVRDLDPTRLVTAALFKETRGTTVVVDDPLADDLDVQGVNEYVGWYEGKPSLADSLTWQLAYDKPLVISEFGGGALAGHHGSIHEVWTEDHQAYLYRQQVGMLSRIDGVAGVSPWILMDFRSPRRPLPGIQDFWNRKGVVSPEGQRKMAFDVMREWYGRIEAEGRP
ncbi:glycoside hydrolase family 2 protein [Rubrivirga sp.]|uniref:glycoside hydrolase family 2 protein n=1 Tax=Rubrivirga sp. TaxID=1885344 RepID=UPI003C71A976